MDGEVCLIFKDQGWGNGSSGGSGGSGGSLLLGDELLIFYVIDDGLSVAKHCCGWDEEVSVEGRTVV